MPKALQIYKMYQFIRLKDIEFDVLKIFFILIFSSFTSISHAQLDTPWELQSEKNGVKLYSSTKQCAGNNMLLLKLENTNQDEKHVNFSIVIESIGHNMPLRPQSFEMKGNETKQGDCDEYPELKTDLKDINNFKLVVVMRVN